MVSSSPSLSAVFFKPHGWFRHQRETEPIGYCQPVNMELVSVQCPDRDHVESLDANNGHQPQSTDDNGKLSLPARVYSLDISVTWELSQWQQTHYTSHARRQTTVIAPACRQTVGRRHDERSVYDWQQQPETAAAWQHERCMQEDETVHTSDTDSCAHRMYTSTSHLVHMSHCLQLICLTPGRNARQQQVQGSLWTVYCHQLYHVHQHMKEAMPLHHN